ncbi:ABC transporter substrate-binding protein [Desulfovibrio sp. JC022]|uniref:substrate-binding periplasmic protein n=1 Tax=Desulfovibrio sp. JC022 TaxID=2593642 RepID=UPI0013D57A3D|nr:transporter substrate-binding domain-containing protein [Desulfovibrio sp. JC022]NDV21340.1 amino acid ABC transporter substrate-binding protein [Desulfovibrio sp. JC022]
MKQILTILLVILFSTGTSCFAQEVIVPLNHYPPWRIINNRQISGINIELTDALLQKINLKATYVVRPWKRAQWMMKKGTADLMSGLLNHNERKEYMEFLEPPYKTESSKAFYILKGSTTKITCYEDLYRYRIGVTLGTKFFPKFDHDAELKKDMGKDASNNFQKLEAGRIDTFILTETVGDYLIHKLGYQDKVKKADYVYSKPLAVYFAVSKKSPLAERVPELNTVLKKMVESGEMKKTIDRFLTNLN